jgi:LAS superfamily LD-carboxypeptidase LdcB
MAIKDNRCHKNYKHVFITDIIFVVLWTTAPLTDDTKYVNITNNKQQTTNNKQQTTNNKQQTTNNKQQTTNNKQQTTNNKQRLLLSNIKQQSKTTTKANAQKQIPRTHYIPSFSEVLSHISKLIGIKSYSNSSKDPIDLITKISKQPGPACCPLVIPQDWRGISSIIIYSSLLYLIVLD